MINGNENGLDILDITGQVQGKCSTSLSVYIGKKKGHNAEEK
jgi:hypothetical protein